MKQYTKVSFATAMLITATIILSGYIGCIPSAKSKKNSNVETSMVSKPAIELKTNMRKLWEDHVTWTRNVILCLVDDVAGTEQAVKRLYQNQDDIGNSIKPFYGEEAGKKLTDLLHSHISISAEVILAAKAGNAGLLQETNKRWYENSDEISVFLSKANNNWELADMKMMMHNHLKLTSDEAVQRITKEYGADVIAYDQLHFEILKMSDILAEGIIKQFPEKFETVAVK